MAEPEVLAEPEMLAEPEVLAPLEAMEVRWEALAEPGAAQICGPRESH